MSPYGKVVSEEWLETILSLLVLLLDDCIERPYEMATQRN